MEKQFCKLNCSYGKVSHTLNYQFFKFPLCVSVQHLWLKDHKLCAGKLQSPIALSSARSLPLPLPALETIGYHNFLKNPVNLKNDGHSGNFSYANIKWGSCVILDNVLL